MRRKNFFRGFCSLMIGALLLFSCQKEGKTVYVTADGDDAARDMVFFVSKKGQLGDLGYVDALYRGVVKGALSCDLMVSLVELASDTSKTVTTLDYMLDYMQKEKADRRAVVVIANDNLEGLLHRYEQVLTKAPNVDFLLCESRDTTLPIYTVRIPQYGVWYQAGMLASKGLPEVDSVLIVNANAAEEELRDMSGGFCDAVRQSGSGIYVENTWLKESSGGYDLAAETYRQSYDIDSIYNMVVPLCGGSAQGFFRYNRENPESFYTLGVDTDMQFYSQRVPFSVVKHLEQIMQNWIYDWWNGKETMALHQEFGLEKGGTEIVIADSYEDLLGPLAAKYYELAVQKEREYEAR